MPWSGMTWPGLARGALLWTLLARGVRGGTLLRRAIWPRTVRCLVVLRRAVWPEAPVGAELVWRGLAGPENARTVLPGTVLAGAGLSRHGAPRVVLSLDRLGPVLSRCGLARPVRGLPGARVEQSARGPAISCATAHGAAAHCAAADRPAVELPACRCGPVRIAALGIGLLGPLSRPPCIERAAGRARFLASVASRLRACRASIR
jgi:hypothetical protein